MKPTAASSYKATILHIVNNVDLIRRARKGLSGRSNKALPSVLPSWYWYRCWSPQSERLRWWFINLVRWREAYIGPAVSYRHATPYQGMGNPAQAVWSRTLPREAPRRKSRHQICAIYVLPAQWEYDAIMHSASESKDSICYYSTYSAGSMLSFHWVANKRQACSPVHRICVVSLHLKNVRHRMTQHNLRRPCTYRCFPFVLVVWIPTNAHYHLIYRPLSM